MKKQLQIIMMLFITVSIAMADTIAIETFDYEVDMEINLNADGGVGWDGPWEMFEGQTYSDAVTIAEEGDLPSGVEITTTGNRYRGECISTGQAMRLYRPLANPIVDDGSDIWLSFIIESENAIGESWQGVSFWSPGGENEQSLFGKNWTPMNYGIVFRGSGVDTDIPVENNVPVWMVVKVELSGDDAAEQCYVWVNPDPSVEPSTDDAGATTSGLLNNGVTHIACHFGNTEGIVVYFDELRIGNTFDDVVYIEEVGINKESITAKNSSCYPNPFNTSTTIDFNVNSRELVNLDIYNVVGEKIKTLVDGVQTPGNYKIQWNAEDQPSGIYFYKLQIGNATEINKILLK